MAWSVWKVEYVDVYKRRDKREIHLLKVSGTADASGSGDLVLSTGLNTSHGASEGAMWLARLIGGTLYAIEYVPDGTATPTSNPQFTVDTESGSKVFDYTFTAATAEMQPGAATTGFFPPLTDLIFASTTLANTKKAVWYVWIEK